VFYEPLTSTKVGDFLIGWVSIHFLRFYANHNVRISRYITPLPFFRCAVHRQSEGHAVQAASYGLLTALCNNDITTDAARKIMPGQSESVAEQLLPSTTR